MHAQLEQMYEIGWVLIDMGILLVGWSMTIHFILKFF